MCAFFVILVSDFTTCSVNSVTRGYTLVCLAGLRRSQQQSLTGWRRKAEGDPALPLLALKYISRMLTGEWEPLEPRSLGECPVHSGFYKRDIASCWCFIAEVDLDLNACLCSGVFVTVMLRGSTFTGPSFTGRFLRMNFVLRGLSADYVFFDILGRTLSNFLPEVYRLTMALSKAVILPLLLLCLRSELPTSLLTFARVKCFYQTAFGSAAFAGTLSRTLSASSESPLVCRLDFGSVMFEIRLLGLTISRISSGCLLACIV